MEHEGTGEAAKRPLHEQKLSVLSQHHQGLQGLVYIFFLSNKQLAIQGPYGMKGVTCNEHTIYMRYPCL